jgi:alkylation response protein AidB-like acyl-CoA dehydrogenase
MSHYKSNLRDIEFNLFEVLRRQDLLDSDAYPELDTDTVRGILAELERLASGPLAESYADGDRNPPVFDQATHSVRIPESLRKSYRAFMDAEFYRLSLPPELGGTNAPRSLNWAMAELILGSNPAVWMYASGHTMARVLWDLGTPEQKKFAELAVDREWGATMVLTEPDAGSDVGAGRTRAIANEDGTWRIEGVKRFITSGEHDLADNIFHLVLARPEGAGPGTKGLSMFLVPKFHVDLRTGELGERNGVYITNVEHKMGLKASTTCEVTFGASPAEPAIGTLVGDVHDGIRQMFKVIEDARMMVGTKAIATLSTGYLNALDFARNRVQGADLTKMTDKAAPRVAIIAHPDVRRMLMLQKAYAEGMRAVALYTASVQDTIQLGADGADAAVGLNDLLLPIVKGVGSERSYELLTLSLQTLGGSGFLQDYPIEQYIRDAKIDSLYEGTTGIQSMDLFFRKVIRDGGKALGQLLGSVKDFAGQDDDGELKQERAALAEAAAHVEAMAGAMTGFLIASQEAPAEIYKTGLNTVRFLMALGDLTIGWLLLRHAEIAQQALSGEPGNDTDFYTGKVATARFFTANVLPRLAADRQITEQTSNDLMELPETAF